MHTAAIDGVTIGGNLISSGGGPGVSANAPFPVKDNEIRGNIVFNGLRDGWYGVIRNEVGGNVVLVGNHSDAVGGYHGDADEVVANTIGGNLVCLGNTPAPQLGDALEGRPSDYGPNDVRGNAVGQCAAPGLVR